MKKVYLAGPGVFRPNALQWGAHLQALCRQHNLIGLYPLDKAAPADLDGNALAKWIFNANCQLISTADVVLADVSVFRSASEPDSGTAFEIGFAHALGKPIYLWLPDIKLGTTMLSRVGAPVDMQGWHVENFGAPLNLMLWQAATGVIDAPDAEQAMAQLANYLLKQQ